MFRTDPRIADLIDPAVYIRADDEGRNVSYMVVERLQLIEVMSNVESDEGLLFADEPREEGAPVAILVMDEESAGSLQRPRSENRPRTMAMDGA